MDESPVDIKIGVEPLAYFNNGFDRAHTQRISQLGFIVIYFRKCSFDNSSTLSQEKT